MDFKEQLRQFISNYVQGPNADALLSTLADEDERLQTCSIAVNDQLSITSASGIYIDKRLSQVGITRPADLGMDDFAFKKMGIEIDAAKQITEVLHTILQTFYGDETVRASAISTLAEPYSLKDGDELLIEIEDGQVLSIPFTSSDFRNINEASAQEVADIISRFARSQNLSAFASVFQDRSGNNYVAVYGSAKGPFSMVKVLGGEVQVKLEFPKMRPTELSLNTTIWEITRPQGSTIRFRWYSGPKPALETVVVGDSTLIYGDSFVNQGLSGTFIVKNLRPATNAPAYDSGWFEVENPEVQGLRATPADTAPQPNTTSDRYSLIAAQSEYDDLKFFLPVKNTSYGKLRYALAFEPRDDLLKVYLPATTKVVGRDIIGSAHLHALYDQFNLDGTFGHATDKSKQIRIINDRSISYPQAGYDNEGFDGLLTIGSNSYPIEYVNRANFMATVVLKAPHGLKGEFEWLSSVDYVEGDEVFFGEGRWACLIACGPSYGGARQPNFTENYWRFVGSDSNTSNVIVTINCYDIESEPVESFNGPYVIDPSASYSLTSTIIKTRERVLAGSKLKTLFVNGMIDSKPGLILFDLNKPTQEGPIAYFNAQTTNAPTSVQITNLSQNGHGIIVSCASAHGAIQGSRVQISGISTVSGINGNYVVDSVPNTTTYTCTSTVSRVASIVGEGVSTTVMDGSASTLVIDPSYTFKMGHDIGSDVTLLSDRRAYIPEVDGTDYGFYLTGTAEGRVYCESLIKQITALGIKLEVIILYPYGVGLGNGLEPLNGPKNNDVEVVWGT